MSTKRVVLVTVFAVVGSVGFYLLGEALGGSGVWTAVIFLGILFVFLVIKWSRDTSSRRDNSVQDD